jgi:hypothetical protein
MYVTTKRDMTRLEAAEMRFLGSVKGYTKLDKLRSEVIRKELEISGIQDVRSKHKLDQPSWKNGQHQTPETRPQLQTSREKRSWTPQETMAMRRCRNRSNDLIHGGRLLLLLLLLLCLYVCVHVSTFERADWSSRNSVWTLCHQIPHKKPHIRISYNLRTFT